MKRTRTLYASLLLATSVAAAYGQSRTVTGKIVSSLNQPVSGAVLSFNGMDDITTQKDGTFKAELKDGVRQISVWAPGYYSTSQLIGNRSDIVIMLVPEDKYKYNEEVVLPHRVDNTRPDGTTAVNIAKKDFTLGATKIDRALSGQVAGLQVTTGSGMPGEGSYMNLRGLRSLSTDNAPLIVINGVPYLTDKNASPLINGFSKNIFQAYDLNDIQNITVLKGAEAALYGSLGANGVIMIETDGANSNDMDTKVSFYGTYGVSWNNKRMSLLKGADYKSYLSDVGMTYFGNMEQMFDAFPFLSSSADNKYNYLYNNNTNWQDLLYRKAFTTDNTVRVEGGDEIAKYDLSLGYSSTDGILKSTSLNNYHTQLNTNVLVGKKIELSATVGLAYISGSYQNQGMYQEYNPLLAAYARSPYLSPYERDIDGSDLTTFSQYYYGQSTNMDFAVSNPLAIVNTLDAKSKQYDINIRANILYRPITDLVISGTFGLYYNYNRESMFIPGVTDKAIVPVYDKYGIMNNTVREGVGTTVNYFGNINAQYTKTFNYVHRLNVLGGMQLMLTDREYDAGQGRNTDNDFYNLLSNVDAVGKSVSGYAEKWNWMNYYAHADYTYHNMWKVSANMSVDGSSASGTDAPRFYVYPSFGLTWMGKSLGVFQNATWLNKLDIHADYSMTGNSLFSPKYGKFYYTSAPYQTVSGIIRSNIPNTDLRPEKNAQVNVGLNLTALNNRLELSFNAYRNKTTDGLMMTSMSPIFGTSPYYSNMAEITNKGIELSLSASLVRLRDFEWVAGGNISWNRGKINSLGKDSRVITSFGNGAELLSEVGGQPYQFYGYQALGVFATQAEADAANLTNDNGQKYAAGDVHYADLNNDGRIDDKDRVALGSPSPTYFGGFFTRVNYKGFALSAEFSFSKGNKAYNAVRRSLESLSSADNQSSAVNRRWQLEGQETDIPRANWGDPIGNNDFSSRWIEDASYLRMKSLTFSYTFTKKFLDFFRSGTIYVTGENLFTTTKYLGLDPEFSYSYTDNVQGFDNAKVMQPKSVKLGINLKF